MGLGKPYSKQEDAIIIAEFPTCADPKELSARLGRTYSSLRTRANLLGLKRDKAATVNLWRKTVLSHGSNFTACANKLPPEKPFKRLHPSVWAKALQGRTFA